VLLFRTDAKSAESVDMMGNSKSLSLADGICPVSLGDHPVSLIFKEATRIDAAGSLAVLQCGLIIANQPLQANLQVCNPTDVKQKVLLLFQYPNFLSCKKVPAEIELAPLEKKNIPLDFNFLSKVPLKSQSEKITANLHYSISGWDVPCQASLKFAPAIKNTPMAKRTPDFEISSHAHNHSCFPNDPGNLHLLWKGLKDLSAKIWLANENDTFKLHVVVEDDVHVQKESSADSCYRGDSIQVGLKFPEQNGYWKFGAALHENGMIQKALWMYPKDCVRENVLKDMSIKISRNGTCTMYNISIPYRSLKTSPSVAYSGFQFNLLVNNNDEGVRKK
jgi:hypothetical protein